MVGVVCSVIGTFLIRTKENATQKSLLATLRKGTYTAAVLAAVIAAPVTYYIMGSWGPYIAILAGLVAGCAIGYFTEYYTSDTYKPTQKLAAASETGSATVIIGGLSLGMMSTIAPSSSWPPPSSSASMQLAAGLPLTGGSTASASQPWGCCPPWASPWLPTPMDLWRTTPAASLRCPVCRSLFGSAPTLGLSGQHHRRHRKGLRHRLGLPHRPGPVGLLCEYRGGEVGDGPGPVPHQPLMLVGLFLGAMLTFVFSALTMSAVQTAAQSIVVEVRRQFREIAGIMEYQMDPDYASCVALCTKGALREMVAPALLAIIVPILTGLLLGPEGVVGLLGGVSVTGFAMAVFMSNAGGAWDNAKKYIESGTHGGKGSDCHKAAVIGDTVGDPFKDTSGPSLNILIKLCSTVSIVFSGLITSIHLLG